MITLVVNPSYSGSGYQAVVVTKNGNTMSPVLKTLEQVSEFFIRTAYRAEQEEANERQ